MADWKDREILRLEGLLKQAEDEKRKLEKHVAYYRDLLRKCRHDSGAAFLSETVNKDS
jgi:hypothetical protein